MSDASPSDALGLLVYVQDEMRETSALIPDALQAAGLDEVLPRLRDDALPHSFDKTGAHLAAVVATIRECERLAVEARNKLMLQWMRNE